MKLQHKVDVMEKEVNTFKASAQNRNGLLKKMESLQTLNQEKILKLDEKIKLRKIEIPRCRFGSFCIRIFRKFDHSFVYCKVNNQTSGFSCNEFGKDLKTKIELNDHMKFKHEPTNLRIQIERECQDEMIEEGNVEDFDGHEAS